MQIVTWQEYWNWSWDELVAYDMPTIFDYVHSKTGQTTGNLWKIFSSHFVLTLEFTAMTYYPPSQVIF